MIGISVPSVLQTAAALLNQAEDAEDIKGSTEDLTCISHA